MTDREVLDVCFFRFAADNGRSMVIVNADTLGTRLVGKSLTLGFEDMLMTAERSVGSTTGDWRFLERGLYERTTPIKEFAGFNGPIARNVCASCSGSVIVTDQRLIDAIREALVDRDPIAAQCIAERLESKVIWRDDAEAMKRAIEDLLPYAQAEANWWDENDGEYQNRKRQARAREIAAAAVAALSAVEE